MPREREGENENKCRAGEMVQGVNVLATEAEHPEYNTLYLQAGRRESAPLSCLWPPYALWYTHKQINATKNNLQRHDYESDCLHIHVQVRV